MEFTERDPVFGVRASFLGKEMKKVMVIYCNVVLEFFFKEGWLS
jgi:hypothetical protein